MQDKKPTTTENKKPAAIVRVHRPNLTPEERAKRMEEIRRAAARVILAAERMGI